MTATKNAIVTEFRDGELMPVPLKAGAIVLQGTFALADATGFAIGSIAAVAGTQKCLGVWDHSSDNTDGEDGDRIATVRRNKQFLFANLSTDPLTQADLGVTVYVADNQTVAKTSDSDARPVAGKFMGFDTQYTDYVWVEIQ